ncbi:hypothetical protein [Microbulbifer halophilus]|uniref:hypothetical protein n=1 Tax=Microbulbifer halophilus TaxID=453963 RepID=UPI003607AED3
MITAQQYRHGSMHIAIPLADEYPVGGQQAQHSIQGIGIHAGSIRECGSRCGLVVEHIGNTEFGDHVYTARNGVGTDKIAERLKFR